MSRLAALETLGSFENTKGHSLPPRGEGKSVTLVLVAKGCSCPGGVL